MTYLCGSPDAPLPSPSSDSTTVAVVGWNMEIDSEEDAKNNDNSNNNRGSVRKRHVNTTEDDWRSHPISLFWEKYHGVSPSDRQLPSKVRKFYKKQDELIENFQSAIALVQKEEAAAEAGEGAEEASELERERHQTSRHQTRVNSILIKVTLFLNLMLFVSKTVASVMSGSLSVISSLMDSAVDLVSGAVLWFAAHLIHKAHPYSYPTGRKRLEPVAVIILAVVMASASLQIIVEACQTIYNMALHDQGPPEMTNLTVGLVASTIVVKLSLFLACWKFGRGESILALRTDQFNDCLSNSVALVFSTLSARIEGAPYLKYFDPTGAIIIGCYIVISWFKVGSEHARNLTGYVADPKFLQQITFICVNHHPSIERLDTVRAFHLGSNYMVEVDIVLPRDMDLHKAHDIGESLQRKLESIDEVERAFVHLDYEYAHHPNSEHKVS